MSAIRNSSGRSQARKKRTAPYVRGLFGTFARFFGLGDRDDQTDESTDAHGGLGNGSATGSPMNGHAHKNYINLGNRSPLKPSQVGNGLTSVLPESPPSAVPNSEQVANYFSQKMGTNVSANEVESMVSNLQTTHEPEGFRFTFTTPGRDSPPSFSSQPNSAFTPNASPTRRRLTKNPNGIYRWEGAGSAKPTHQRNRFGSPAFAASPVKAGRPSGIPILAATPSSDNKRRKVAEETSNTARQSGSGSAPNTSLPFPITSPTTPRIQRQKSPVPPTRLRTPAKPTAPVNPSPLRQAWSDGSSSSSREGERTSPSQPSKATKAANFMADLIKETAPPNKPDLTNPYQAASPLGKVGPPRRSTRRPRAPKKPGLSAKEQKEEEEKKKAEERKKKEEEERMKALSAQAIIEATVPKGSKRSRPPAHLENKSSTPDSRASPPRIEAAPSPVIEEPEEQQKSKRSKPTIESRGDSSNSKKAALSDVTVEEIQDVDMQAPDKGKDKGKESPTEQARAGSSRASFVGFKPSAVPREPSKLRFSIQPESTPSSASSSPAPTPAPSLPEPTPGKSVPAAVPSAFGGAGFTFTPPAPKPTSDTKPASSPFSGSTAPAPAQSPAVVKAQVRALDVKSLPTFLLSPTATPPLSSSPEHVKAHQMVRALPVSELPTFDFSSKVASGSGSGSLPTASTSTSATSTSTTASISTPAKGFDFAAAGMKAPTAEKDSWTCGTCMLSNRLSANKCTTCDEPRPGVSSASGSKPTPAPSAFGFGQPPVASSSTSSSPSTTPAPAPTQGFNWAAAGMQAPKADLDSWKCGTCGLTSPKSAAKCMVCDEPAPAGVVASPSASVTAGGGSSSTSASGSGGFGVGGGFKPAGGFTPSVPSSSGFTPSGGFKPSGFTPFTTSNSSTSSSSGFKPLGFTPSSSSGNAKPVGFTPSFGALASSPVPASNLFGSSAPADTKPTVPASATTSTSTFSPSAVKGFDFAAAGMKLPAREEGSWTCSVCALSNLAGATKCQTCEQPR